MEIPNWEGLASPQTLLTCHLRHPGTQSPASLPSRGQTPVPGWRSLLHPEWLESRLSCLPERTRAWGCPHPRRTQPARGTWSKWLSAARHLRPTSVRPPPALPSRRSGAHAVLTAGAHGDTHPHMVRRASADTPTAPPQPPRCSRVARGGYSDPRERRRRHPHASRVPEPAVRSGRGGGRLMTDGAEGGASGGRGGASQPGGAGG